MTKRCLSLMEIDAATCRPDPYAHLRGAPGCGLDAAAPRARAAAVRRQRPPRHRRASFTARRRHAAIRVSLATVYNTLHQFTAAGLLREVVVEPGRSYFDTNIDDHHHFFCESTGMLQDIPGAAVMVGRAAARPSRHRDQHRVDVIIRVRRPKVVAALRPEILE